MQILTASVAWPCRWYGFAPWYFFPTIRFRVNWHMRMTASTCNFQFLLAYLVRVGLLPPETAFLFLECALQYCSCNELCGLHLHVGPIAKQFVFLTARDRCLANVQLPPSK